MKESIHNYWHDKILKYHCFILVIILSLFFLDIHLAAFLTIIFAWFIPEILYPLLIIMPAIKNVVIFSQGFTMMKLLGLLYLVLLIYRKHSQEIIEMVNSWHFKLIFLYVLLIMLNIINFRLFSWEKVSMLFSLNLASIFKDNMFNIVKILFSLFLFIDFASMKIDDLKKLLNNMSTVISIIVLPIFIYTITLGFQSQISWHVIRATLNNTKPGEYSYLLSVLIPFLIYCIIYHQNIIIKIISLTSLCEIIYLISITISRGGALALIFSVIMSILLLQYNHKRILIFFIMIAALMFLLESTGIINIDYWIVRNKIMSTDISKLTTHRYDFWITGLKYSFSSIRNFIFGGGSSPLLERYINMTDGVRGNVMHNIYIGNLVKYGFLGLMMFCLIMGRIIYKFINYRAFLIKNHYEVFLVPFLSLSVSLFAGLFVSWEFREILWILTGMSAGILYALGIFKKFDGEITFSNKERIN